MGFSQLILREHQVDNIFSVDDFSPLEFSLSADLLLELDSIPSVNNKTQIIKIKRKKID